MELVPAKRLSMLLEHTIRGNRVCVCGRVLFFWGFFFVFSLLFFGFLGWGGGGGVGKRAGFLFLFCFVFSNFFFFFFFFFGGGGGAGGGRGAERRKKLTSLCKGESQDETTLAFYFLYKLYSRFYCSLGM